MEVINIDRLNKNLSKIQGDVLIEANKKLSSNGRYNYTVIKFNNLFYIVFIDYEDSRCSLDKIKYQCDSFYSSDIDELKHTLDFVSSNEDNIREAILNSLE